MLDQKIELLRKVPLFDGLPDDQIELIADAGEKRYFEAGENLIAAGETGTTAFLILTGKAGWVRVEQGENILEDIWPGTLVGELGMLVETVHAVTVTAENLDLGGLFCLGKLAVNLAKLFGEPLQPKQKLFCKILGDVRMMLHHGAQ